MTRLSAIGACVVCGALSMLASAAEAGNQPPRHERQIRSGGLAIRAREVLPRVLPDGTEPIVRLKIRNHTDLMVHGVTVSVVGRDGRAAVIEGVRFPGDRRRASGLDRNQNMRLDAGERGATDMPDAASTATRFMVVGDNSGLKPKKWKEVDIHLSRNLRNHEFVVVKVCTRFRARVGGVLAHTWFDIDHGGPSRDFRLNAADVGTRTLLPGSQNVLTRFIKQTNRVSKNHVEITATRRAGNPAIRWGAVARKRGIAALNKRHGWVSMRSSADDNGDRRVDAGENDHDYTPAGGAAANRIGMNLLRATSGHDDIDDNEETMTLIIMDRRPEGRTVREGRRRRVAGTTDLNVRLGVRADRPPESRAGDRTADLVGFLDAFTRGDLGGADLTGDGRLDLLDLLEMIENTGD